MRRAWVFVMITALSGCSPAYQKGAIPVNEEGSGKDVRWLKAEAKRLEEMAPDALEDELRARLERLESRINELRRALPASLTISRLRKAVAVLARLDAQGALENSHANGDSAKAVALRLGRAIDELELLLREVQPVAV